MSSRVLTAVAWPYANGPRHIGHVSGFGVPSDVFSRYRRMVGDQVLMVSGTDEHGTPIQVQADAEGLSPRQLADKYNGVITKDLQGLGLQLAAVAVGARLRGLILPQKDADVLLVFLLLEIDEERENPFVAA